MASSTILLSILVHLGKRQQNHLKAANERNQGKRDAAN